MKRPRMGLASVLWLVAVVAAFLGGVRCGERRASRSVISTFPQPAPGRAGWEPGEVRLWRGP